MIFDVYVHFDIDGIHGREVVIIEADHTRHARAMAWGWVEEEMIDAGLKAWHCGCCIMPARAGGQVRSVETIAIQREAP